MRAFRQPRSLRPGSLVAVVAPSGPFGREELFRGLAWLRSRYRLRVGASILARHGYLAGTDEQRSRELADAMLRPEIDAIVCARGGYGAMRIGYGLPWDAFAESPKWIVGFSDVTALHLAANARGIASVHAPNVTGLGRSISPAERASFLAALEGGRREPWAGLEVVRRGRAHGPIVGGNLALVAAVAAAGGLHVPEGDDGALEDVTEKPYRVDRMLTSLLEGGYLSRAAAVVFGGFTQCDPGPDGVTVEEVLRERTAKLGVPVVLGAPFGHGAPNHAFVLGAEATLDGDVLRF